jgi:5-methylcytosine-specific restriction endonuclease McrA
MRWSRRKRRRKRGSDNYRKKARRLGVAYESINVMRVFDRDGWRCQICGKDAPKKNRGTTRSNAPELDHRIPMSVGGGHLYSNVQCVHRACNLMKSNKTHVGQLPLFNQ